MPAQLRTDWTIGQQLGGGHFGTVHELGSSHVARMIPFDKLDTGNDLRKKLLDRVSELQSLHLPDVATPISSGETSGAVYLVERRLAVQLSITLPADNGLPIKDATRRFFGLLVGLTALHARKIVHGDLRPENVFLNSGANGQESAWLADVAIGHLWWWSKGECISPRAPDYYPPEWANGAKCPTGQSDVYMLGVLAAEMYLGRKAVRQMPASDAGFRSFIKPKLTEAKVPADVRRLLWRLLDPNPATRPVDAAAARLEYEGSLRRSRQLMVGLLLLAVLTLVVWLGRVAMLRTGERNRATAALGEAERNLIEVRAEFNDLQREIAEGPFPPVGPPTRPPSTDDDDSTDDDSTDDHDSTETAQLAWRKFAPLGGATEDSGNWTPLREAINQQPRNEQDYLVRWYNAIRDVRVWSSPWFVADEQLAALYRRAAAEPWNEENLSAARSRLEHLTAAAGQFRLWAENRNLSFSDVERLVNDPNRSADVNDILKSWLLQFVEGSGAEYTLRLTSAKAPDGWGTRRLVGVQSSVWVEGDDHNWENTTQHEYSADEAPQEVRFSWRPGEPTGIILYGERSWIDGRRHKLINAQNQFQGPLALWLMHVSARVSDKRGFFLRFEIVDCPGPPREVVRGVTNTLIQELTGG